MDVQVAGPDRQDWQVGGTSVIAERGQRPLDHRSASRCLRLRLRATMSPCSTGAYGVSFEVLDPLDRDVSAAGDTNVVEAPMPMGWSRRCSPRRGRR